MGRLYDRTLGNILPSDRLFAVLCCLLLNSLIYWGAQTFTADWPHLDMTTALDRRIPVVPAWTVIYVAAFPFWAVSYVVMARGRNWYTIMSAEVLAKLVCGVIFFLMPTTNQRPLLTDEPFGWLLQLIYEMDAATCLFPSIHCLESWICFAGLRTRKEFPGAVRWGSLIFAVLVCVSTLTTYQHVLADVFAGVLLAEGSIQLAYRLHFGKRLERCFTVLNQFLLGSVAEPEDSLPK